MGVVSFDIVYTDDFDKYIINWYTHNTGGETMNKEAVITVKQGRKNTYCHSVEVMGPSVVRYGGNDHPILPCGARVVIETESEVRIGE